MNKLLLVGILAAIISLSSITFAGEPSLEEAGPQTFIKQTKTFVTPKLTFSIDGYTKSVVSSGSIFGNLTWTGAAPAITVPKSAIAQNIKLTVPVSKKDVYFLLPVVDPIYSVEAVCEDTVRANGTTTDCISVSTQIGSNTRYHWTPWKDIVDIQFVKDEAVQFMLIVSGLPQNKLIAGLFNVTITYGGTTYSVEIDPPWFNTSVPLRRQWDINVTSPNATAFNMLCPVNATNGTSAAASGHYNIWTNCQQVNGVIYQYYDTIDTLQFTNGSSNERFGQVSETGPVDNFSTTNLFSSTGVVDAYFFNPDVSDNILSAVSGNTLTLQQGSPVFETNHGGMVGHTVDTSVSASGWKGSTSDAPVEGLTFAYRAIVESFSNSGTKGIIYKFSTDDGTSQIVMNLQAGAPRCGVRVNGSGVDSDSATAITIGTTTDILCTYDGSAIRTFVNGILDTTSAAALQGMHPINGDLCLGVDSATPSSCNLGNAFIGHISDAYFYNKNISEAEAFAMYKSYNNTNPVFWTAGPEEALAVGPEITINSPVNGTILNASVILNFTATDDSDLTFGCGFRLNTQNSFTDLGTIGNNTSPQVSIPNLNMSQYTVFVNCTDSASTTTTVNQTFTLLHYNVSSQIFNSIGQETNTTNYTLVIDIASNVADINGTLVYNSTGIPSIFQTTTSNQINLTANSTIPLVGINNTNLSVSWNFTVEFTNSSLRSDQSTEETQQIVFSYLISSVNFDLLVLEGEMFDITTNVTKIVDFATITNNITINGTIFSTNETSNTVTVVSFLGNITVNTTINGTELILPFSTTAFYHFQGDNRNQTFAENFTISLVVITACDTAATNTTTLNLTIFDEVIPTLRVIANVDIDLNITFGANMNKQFSFGLQNQSSYRLCIFPTSGVNVTANATIQFFNLTTHPDRNFFLTNSDLSNQTSFVQMFLLEDSIQALTRFIVQDDKLQPLRNVIVFMQRQYIDEGIFRTVAMVKTDDFGQAIGRVEPNDQFYMFVVQDNGIILQEFEPLQVPFDPLISDFATVELNLVQSSLSDFYSYFGNVASGCSFNNVTSEFICTVADTSGLIQTYNLTVKQQKIVSVEIVCSDQDSSAVTSLICPIVDVTNSTYQFTLVATFDGSRTLLQSGSFSFTGQPIYGLTGLFATWLIFIAIILLAHTNPPFAILFGVISIGISAIMGIFIISTGSMIGLIITTLILIWRTVR